MDADIWIAKISPYNKFCNRLYIETYKGNDKYKTVYYDILKDSWDYKKGTKKEGIDFIVLSDMLISALKKGMLESACYHYSEEYLNQLNSNELAGKCSYPINCLHPEFKSADTRHKEFKATYEEKERMFYSTTQFMDAAQLCSNDIVLIYDKYTLLGQLSLSSEEKVNCVVGELVLVNGTLYHIEVMHKTSKGVYKLSLSKATDKKVLPLDIKQLPDDVPYRELP